MDVPGNQCCLQPSKDHVSSFLVVLEGAPSAVTSGSVPKDLGGSLTDLETPSLICQQSRLRDLLSVVPTELPFAPLIHASAGRLNQSTHVELDESL